MGIFLSFVGHFLTEIVSDTVVFQIVISAGGIALMTAIAHYGVWSTSLDKAVVPSSTRHKAWPATKVNSQ